MSGVLTISQLNREMARKVATIEEAQGLNPESRV